MVSHSKNIATIKRKIASIDLNLSGETILTELGNNNYFYTPLIAALAGANKVYAWTGSNDHFDVHENVRKFVQLADLYGVSERIIIRIDEKPTSDISSASIITNSGFIRPIDDEFLSNCQTSAVIPLMYEAWEIRPSDIDIEAATKYNIKVAGTFENHKDVAVFNGVGPLAIKLALEAGHEIYNNKVIVFSDDHFGQVTAKAFENFGAGAVVLTADEREVLEELEDTEFIYICDYDENGQYGVDLLKLDDLLTINPNIGVVHLYGELNFDLFSTNGISVYPRKNGKSMFMTETLAYLGPQLIISLTVAGFKVGALMRDNQQTELVQPINY